MRSTFFSWGKASAERKVKLESSASSLQSPSSSQQASTLCLDKEASLSKPSLSPPSPQTVADVPIDECPDGGWRAWLVVFGAVCMVLATFGYVNSWGAFQSYYEETLLPDTSPSSIAWIGSMQYALTFMPCIITGRLFDTGYFRISVALASVLMVLATFLVAECTEFWHFAICQGLTIGLASGFVFGPTATVITHWFKKRRATALAVVTMGASIGGTLFPILFRNLVVRVGFQWTMRILGFILIFFLGIGNLAVRRRLPPVKTSGGLVDLTVFRDPALCFYAAAIFTCFLGVFTILTYIGVSAKRKNVPENITTYLVAIANAASAVGRLGAGIIADKHGPLTIIAPATLVAGIVTIAWPFASTEGSYIAVAIVYGAGIGAFIALMTLPIMAMGAIDDVGRRVGLFMTILSFGALAGPPISGEIYKATDNFLAVGMYAGAMIIVAVV